jgi:hypothetical protein
MSSLVLSLFTPLLKIILPVFALIFAGYACRKTNRLGPNASSELNRFVVYLALPALLFDIMATTPWHTLDQPAFIAVFGLGAGGVFGLTVLIRLKQSRHLADASLDGLNAAYPNTGFIGLPLCMLAFGHASLAPAVIATVMTVCVLFAVAIVLIELGLQTEKKLVATLGQGGQVADHQSVVVRAVRGLVVQRSGAHYLGWCGHVSQVVGRSGKPMRTRCARAVSCRELRRRRGENYHLAGLGQAHCATAAHLVAGVSCVRTAGVAGEDGRHTQRVTHGDGAVHAGGILQAGGGDDVQHHSVFHGDLACHGHVVPCRVELMTMI